MAKTKILIVEDQAVTAMTLEDNLRALDYEVTDIVDRGENVLQSIETNSPDVILMDIILKGEMTGIEAAKQVATKYHIPVIYLTASSDEKTFRDARVTDAYGYIIKPFHERELKINIEMALYKKESEERLRKAEEKLREAEIAGKKLAEKRLRQFEEIIEASSDFVGMADKDGNTLFLNKSLKELCKDGRGNAIQEFHPPEAFQKIAKEGIPQAIKKGIWEGENTIYNKKGDIIPISQLILSHKNEEGKLEYVSTIARDISKTKETERVLQKSEERYKNFIQFSKEGIWRMEFDIPIPVVTPIDELVKYILNDGKIVECNEAMARMYSYETAHEFLGSNLMNLFGSQNESEEQVAKERTKFFIQNNFSVENSISTEKNKSGEAIYISNSTLGIIEEGHLLRMWGVQRDVTEKTKAEEALKRSEYNLAQAQRIAKVGDWHWDLINNKLVWSDETFKLYGYQPHEVEVNFELFVSHLHPEDAEKTTSIINSALESKGSYYNEFRVTTKSGDVKSTIAQGEVILNDQDEVIGMRGVIQDITERAQAEETIRDSQQRWDSLVENSNDIISIVDKDSVVRYMNNRPPALKEKGLTENDILGKSIYSFVLEQDHHLVKESLQQVIEEAQTISLPELRGTSLSTYSCTYTPLFIDGMPTGAICIMSEITEKLKIERKVKDSQQKWDSLVKNSNDMISIFDNKNELTFLNNLPAGAKSASLTIKNMMGRSIYDFIANENHKIVDESIKNAFDKKETSSFEVHGATSGRYYSCTVTPLLKNNRTDGTIWIWADINDEIEAQEKIKASEEKFRLLSESANDIIISADKSGKILFVNDAVTSILGYDASELIGEKLSMIIPPEDRNSHDAGLQRIKDGKKPKHKGKTLELFALNKGQTKIPVDVSLSYWKYKDEQYFSAIIKDISERKQTEEILKNAHTELEQRVNERTTELNKANQELRELAYTLSHDLKSPLRSISTLAEWVYTDNQSVINEESQNNLALIKNRVLVLYNLIEGMLDYAKIGESSSNVELIDLNDVVTEVVGLLDMPESITLTVDKKMPSIRTVRIHMFQIFQNLLSNSIKYNDKEEGTIRVECERIKDAWQFSVIDNGMGIEERHFDRVFKIFQTLKSKEKTDSTGIGLSIVKKIIGIYNGKIWMESQFGKGTTFYFTLQVPEAN